MIHELSSGDYLIHGDSLEIRDYLEPESIDAVVTDPPYGLSFMGKEWDHGVPGVEFWQGVSYAMKPGAHLLAFGGTRTYHRLTCAIEDSGLEIRDCVMWVYGSGMPKGHNLKGDHAGWGTALKPAWEPIIVARKPLAGTVATNVAEHGTGALNIDVCRVPGVAQKPGGKICSKRNFTSLKDPEFRLVDAPEPNPEGRWPANVIHDGSDEVLDALPPVEASRDHDRKHSARSSPSLGVFGAHVGQGHRDSGSAARFFYCAKASKKERGANSHPTVKPIALMRYLCRLITPPGGLVLDPFMGSGSTGLAAAAEGFGFIGIEQNKEYLDIAKERLESAKK